MVPGLGIDEVACAIAREFSEAGFEAAESLADSRYAEESALRLASWEWTWGSTPAFSLALDWSGGRARLEVKSGIVASATGAGAESISGFEGHRFGYALPEAAMTALEAGGASVA